MKRIVPIILFIGLFIFFSIALFHQFNRKRPPQPLDLSAHYTEKYQIPSSGSQSTNHLNGYHTFDGVPFHLNGSAMLFGSMMALDLGKTPKDYPDVIGVKVGRRFEELHLLHTTKWPEIEGCTIATVRMNYSDGSNKELEIAYGVHVRDWQRLQTEEREALTHSHSKVVWRGPGSENFKSSQRMFKSLLLNPLPYKRVDTIDVISAGKAATYCLHAATVADADANRPNTPPPAQERPEWDFDGQIKVLVSDAQGNPISDAYVDTSLSVPDTGWATSGAPFSTSAQGRGVVKYPKSRTDLIILMVSKNGWINEKRRVELEEFKNQQTPIEVTIQLSPAE